MILKVTLAPEVALAAESGGALVALESTIITHGLPWPRNLETAQSVEADVREAGATPATIAVIDGEARIGLDEGDLASLARTQDVAKLSRADVSAALVSGRTGSTTVAATMILARLAGIEVFATGGIGGVHRGAEATMDISADLQELAQTPVIVVSAGAKAILDLPKTMEVLETLGVPVIGYRTDEIPAFWSRSSGLTAPIRLDTARQIAEAQNMRLALGLPGGHLVANPIPKEAEIPADVIGPLIDTALQDAEDAGITGKDVTPFLLGRVLDLTKGRSLEANVALVRSNSRLAAEIALALKDLRGER
ncbi:MAG: pseudouridine-5'-phosphate glycosidase [Pseudomonadota bacterium]